jgi:hypothetical protein
VTLFCLMVERACGMAGWILTEGGGGGFEIRPSLVEVEAGQRKRH